MPRKRLKIPCKYTYHDGSACAQYAQRDSDYCRSYDPDKPPTNPRGPGPGNRNAVKHGYYNQLVTAEDRLAMATMEASMDLTDEIAMIRMALRRAAALLNEELSVRELVAVVGVLLAGTGRVAGLLKAQRDISSGGNDGMTEAIAKALEELGEEWGTDLVGNSTSQPGAMQAAAS